MKKTLTMASLSLFLIAMVAAPVSIAQEATPTKSDAQAMKVISKMIDAMGGRKALESLKDTTVSGTMEMISMGMEGGLTLYSLRPNLMRIDIEIMGMTITQAFDGEMAWMFNPQTGANEEMTEQQSEEFKRQAMGDMYLLDPEKYGIVYVSKGQEKIEGKDYDIIEQIHPDGWTATMWVDGSTHLTYKVKAMGTDPMSGGEVETETFTTDYKKVGNVMMAYTMTTYQEGEEFMTMTITDVKVNTGLEASFFKMDG